MIDLHGKSQKRDETFLQKIVLEPVFLKKEKKNPIHCLTRWTFEQISFNQNNKKKTANKFDFESECICTQLEMKTPHVHLEVLLLHPHLRPSQLRSKHSFTPDQQLYRLAEFFSSRAELCNDSPRQPVENWRAESTGGKKENTGRTIGKQWKRLIPSPPTPSEPSSAPC